MAGNAIPSSSSQKGIHFFLFYTDRPAGNCNRTTFQITSFSAFDSSPNFPLILPRYFFTIRYIYNEILELSKNILPIPTTQFRQTKVDYTDRSSQQ